MEKIILRNLEFELLAPLPTFYLNKYLDKFNLDEKAKNEVYRNVYVAYLYRGYLNLKPADLIKSAIALVMNPLCDDLGKFKEWVAHNNRKNYRGIIERFS